MSHAMTPAQEEDAVKTLGISEFIVVPSEWWEQIPADANSVCEYTASIKYFLHQYAKRGDTLLVQGDFGATLNMVYFAFKQGIIPVYATTKRTSQEAIKGDKVTSVREFVHVQFRVYETQCLK